MPPVNERSDSTSWAPGIKNPGLRAAIAANPRLAQRIAHWPQHAAREPSPRVFPSESVPQIQTPIVSDFVAPPDFSPSSAALLGPSDFQAYMRDPEAAQHAAGLIWNAASLAQIIDGRQLRAISSAVSAEELRWALEHIETAMPPQPFTPLSAETVRKRIFQNGTAAAHAWIERLSPLYRVQAAKTLPHDWRGDEQDNTEQAAAIMRATLQALN